MEFRKCRLHTWEGDLPEQQDYLQTPRGSTYQVLAVHVNKRPNPKTVARLDLLKLAPDEIAALPSDTVFHYMRWG